MECPLKYENGQAFIDYINANRHLLHNRSSVYQHGDYHRGNMIIGEDSELYIIDFDRNDFGDPWEDMKSITWDVEISPFFASGRIDGYFENCVPDEFWRLLALYICVAILSSLPWAIPFGEGEVSTMKEQAKAVLEWYNGMTESIPIWYRKCKSLE